MGSNPPQTKHVEEYRDRINPDSMSELIDENTRIYYSLSQENQQLANRIFNENHGHMNMLENHRRMRNILLGMLDREREDAQMRRAEMESRISLSRDRINEGIMERLKGKEEDDL